MNRLVGRTPCMLWTRVICVGPTFCQEAACTAAEQTHVRVDGPLRYTTVSSVSACFEYGWMSVWPPSSLWTVCPHICRRLLQLTCARCISTSNRCASTATAGSQKRWSACGDPGHVGCSETWHESNSVF